MIKTLKDKISLVYLCLVVMIAVVGTASAFNLYMLSKAINGLMTDNYKSINAIGNMLEAIERQDSAELIYINVDKQKGIDMFAENNNEFLKWYNVEYNNITEPGEKGHVDKINSYYVKYVKLFSTLQEFENSGGAVKSADFYSNSIMPDFTNLKIELKNLSLINEKAMFNGKDIATRNARSSMYVILMLTLIALTAGFFTSKFFTGRFLKPIYSLTETIKLVKSGDLNQQANIISQDEIGELAHEFNNMTKRLQQYEQSALGRLVSEKNKSMAIVKSISDPLIVLDTNYRILLLNDACEKFFDIVEEKVVNKHFLEAVRNGEMFDLISSIFESNEEIKQKIILIRSDHEESYFNVVINTVKGLDTKLSGLIIVFQNVTQLKQLERIRTDFIATISHEFKTPLTSIMMGTDLILNDNMGLLNEEQKTVMDAMKEDGERLSDLVNDLLELTKIESGEAVYKVEPCSIDAIIESSIKQFYQKAEHNEVNLYYESDEDLPKIKADSEKIRWVLNNLISNALKYTNARDEILVKAYLVREKMHVTVKDTGVGIPEEYLNKIFEKFVQVKDGDFEMRGTGLGLAVVKEIIEAHGGKIWCESKLDLGSSFIFTLNLA